MPEIPFSSKKKIMPIEERHMLINIQDTATVRKIKSQSQYTIYIAVFLWHFQSTI